MIVLKRNIICLPFLFGKFQGKCVKKIYDNLEKLLFQKIKIKLKNVSKRGDP